MRLRLSKEHDPLVDSNKVIKQCLIHVNFYTRCFENKQVGCGAELLSQLLRHYQSLGSTDVPSLAEGLPVMRQGVTDSFRIKNADMETRIQLRQLYCWSSGIEKTENSDLTGFDHLLVTYVM